MAKSSKNSSKKKHPKVNGRGRTGRDYVLYLKIQFMKPRGKPIKWSPEIAYAVGLITTDGCLSNDRRHIIMRSSDISQLKTFKNCLNLTNKISETKNNGWAIKPAYRVQFGNVILYKWLFHIGLMPNKTKRIGTLKIPDKYFFDFLRGHLDGDGYIRNFQDPVYPSSERLYIIFHSASLKHLKYLQRQIKNLLDINGSIMFHSKEFALQYAKKDSLKLLPRLYYDKKAPCLKRKYKIAHPFLME